ncbi:MAG: hypothetical protein HND58_12070 [Planctomycetota bacterium]|nr:MAG: hypothetical protein HND58_12070 [Planctomycetota bacterium]
MRIRPLTAEVSILPCRTRLPFRFGMHTMTVAPLVTCRVEVEIGGGPTDRSVGYSSDLLVPKWFAKDPDSAVADDWRDLLGAQRAAMDVLLEGARADTAFGHWRRVYAERVESTPRTATDRLVRGEGVSLVERALVDAVCRHAGVGLRQALVEGLLGFDAGALDPTAAGWDAGRLPPPRRGIALRHTVGLLDAIEPGDIAEGERVGDGLPECLVEDIRQYGLTHFKIKITSDSDEQIDRLARVWHAVRREAGAAARVSLDGNEQFDSIGRFVGVLERIGREDRFAGFLDALLLIEQPLARARTFDREANAGMDRLAAFAPCIIDEADAGLWALPEARGARLPRRLDQELQGRVRGGAEPGAVRCVERRGGRRRHHHAVGRGPDDAAGAGAAAGSGTDGGAGRGARRTQRAPLLPRARAPPGGGTPRRVRCPRRSLRDRRRQGWDSRVADRMRRDLHRHRDRRARLWLCWADRL